MVCEYRVGPAHSLRHSLTVIFIWFCREKRLEQEHGLLSCQITVMQHQLEQRTEETIKQRQEHSSIILGLQTDLNHKIEEVGQKDD